MRLRNLRDEEEKTVGSASVDLIRTKKRRFGSKSKALLSFISILLLFFSFSFQRTLLSTNHNYILESTNLEPLTDNKEQELQKKTEEVEHQLIESKQREVVKVENTCKIHQVHFWIGGKSGSTTLFYALTKNNSSFDNKDFGNWKEPCYGSKAWELEWDSLVQRKDLCQVKKKEKIFLLNGCPRNYQASQAKKLVDYGADTFIMLIRDPVDRLVSHVNDDKRRGFRKDIKNVEEFVKNNMIANEGLSLHTLLSRQGSALKNLLSLVEDPERVIIVPIESLKKDAQGVIDSIMDRVGADKYVLDQKSDTHINKGTEGNYEYEHLSNSTRDELRKRFVDDVQLLEKLVGRRFAWSLWARDNHTVVSNDEWLVTSPQGTNLISTQN